jgi:RNA polymerase sigma-70 factor (ECF subfamily)
MMPHHPTATFEALYRAEHGRLLRYFRKRVGPSMAPDLVQEVFMRLFRNGALERVENPRAYLSRAAHNLLIEWARRRMREQCFFYPLDEGRDAPVRPEQTWRIEERDLRRVYRQALRAMPPKTRRIFLMHRLRHLTYREIADQIGIGDKAVEYHMTRALARCRSAIATRE